MFTGIVEDTGTVQNSTPLNPGCRITITSALDWSDTRLGDSVAVDGVCLTVVKLDGKQVTFDLGPETLAVTTLANLDIGRRVHLERAMRLGDRLGGHLVSGHVDGIGTVDSINRSGDALFLRIALPPALLRLCIPKGSICINGTSLTINRLDAESVEFCLIPHTLAVTHFGALHVGDRVNVETDMLGKMVERLLSPHLDANTRERVAR
jgi:riboflavin synthase